MLGEYRDYVTIYSRDVIEDGKEITLDYCEESDVKTLIDKIDDEVNKILKKVNEYDIKRAKEMLEELKDKLS